MNDLFMDEEGRGGGVAEALSGQCVQLCRSAGRWQTAKADPRVHRTGRGIVNRFQREHSAHAPSAYPEVHYLTAPMCAAARERGDADGFHLWAGQTHERPRGVPRRDGS